MPGEDAFHIRDTFTQMRANFSNTRFKRYTRDNYFFCETKQITSRDSYTWAILEVIVSWQFFD